MPITIIGAGMAGLLAANMLRRQKPVILEGQTSLPDNHGALLRFPSDIVARTTGIPFKEVTVTKAVCRGGILKDHATLRDHNEYSYKVTGKVMARSIMNLQPAKRWIAPDNFLELLARDVEIMFGKEVTTIGEGNDPDTPIISTIPMPALMRMVGWGNIPRFESRNVWSATMTLPVETDAYQTIYYPDMVGEYYYRASITGNSLIVECNYDISTLLLPELQEVLYRVMCDFGFGELTAPSDIHPVIKHHRYGKLVPVDDQVRRTFIVAMSDTYNIYSVGRFATWRQILLDDVVHDIQQVERFMSDRSAYGRRLKY